MIEPTILLDLDGVVTNLIKSACRFLDRDYEETMANWPVGVWDLEVAFKMPELCRYLGYPRRPESLGMGVGFKSGPELLSLSV